MVARIARHLKTALLVEAVALPVALFYLAPHWPKTVLGWLLVILLWPPLWFFVEWVSDWVGDIIPGDAVATAVYGVVALLLLLCVYLLYSMFLADYLRPHFY